MLLFENSCFDNQLRYGGLPIPTWCPSNVPVRTMVSAIEKRIGRRGVSLMSFDRASVMALLSTLCTCLESRLLDPWGRDGRSYLRDQDSRTYGKRKAIVRCFIPKPQPEADANCRSVKSRILHHGVGLVFYRDTRTHPSRQGIIQFDACPRILQAKRTRIGRCTEQRKSRK